MINRLTVFTITASFLVTPGAQAAINVLDFYRMGENDPGLVQQGAVAGTTKDSVGTNHLTLPGLPIYAEDSASAAATHVGSSFSLDFLFSVCGGSCFRVWFYWRRRR